MAYVQLWPIYSYGLWTVMAYVQLWPIHSYVYTVMAYGVMGYIPQGDGKGRAGGKAKVEFAQLPRAELPKVWPIYIVMAIYSYCSYSHGLYS